MLLILILIYTHINIKHGLGHAMPPGSAMPCPRAQPCRAPGLGHAVPPGSAMPSPRAQPHCAPWLGHAVPPCDGQQASFVWVPHHRNHRRGPLGPLCDRLGGSGPDSLVRRALSIRARPCRAPHHRRGSPMCFAMVWCRGPLCNHSARTRSTWFGGSPVFIFHARIREQSLVWPSHQHLATALYPNSPFIGWIWPKTFPF